MALLNVTVLRKMLTQEAVLTPLPQLYLKFHLQLPPPAPTPLTALDGDKDNLSLILLLLCARYICYIKLRFLLKNFIQTEQECFLVRDLLM